jgi:2'-5' RNA ligase
MQYDLPFSENISVRPSPLLRPRAQPTERLFLAFFPNLHDRRLIRNFRQRFVGDDDQLLPEWRLHVSLFALGDFWVLPQEIVEATKQAAAAVLSPPILAQLIAVKSFYGAPTMGGGKRRRPLVMLVQGAGLYEFHYRLGASLWDSGLHVGDRFKPHVTLSYGPTVIEERMIEPIDLHLSEFALIHSELGRKRYNFLGRWPLLG